jgi:oligoendopeptidase F
MKQTTIPKRSEVARGDKWNLDSLFADDDAWNAGLADFKTRAAKVNAFRARLTATTPATGTAPDARADADLADALAQCLAALSDAERLAERLGNYAFLQKSADEGDAANLDRVGRYMMAASAFEAETSWLVPAIQALPENRLREWAGCAPAGEMTDSAPAGDANDSGTKTANSRESAGTHAPAKTPASENANPRFADYRVWLEKLLRLKPYILSEKEERILALQIESHGTPSQAFSVLTNVDLDFGTVNTADGPQPLSQTTFTSFLENPDRAVRKEAYEKFYATYDAHKNTIATLYSGSVNQDVALARIRGYSSARAMELFPDRVNEAVYDNLVATVRANLAPLHRYYALRKKVLKVDELRHWDVYVPLVADVKRVTPYAEAVDLVAEAVAPLGSEYVDTIRSGLLGGWVDRYENKGKRSGAFSSGGYEGSPYILLNYKEEVLRDVFTMAHEGGHSMHSHYSARSNPFMSYNYTIFEAEVASTFNEDLLFRHLLKTATDKKMKAYLLCNRASDILATLYRQTMFAEYENTTHALVESGTPLTSELLRSEYRKLLEAYFGPEMVFEETSDLEGLRIPHFYNAFYVYKYATGISASLALAERVSSGGTAERDDYFKFLKSGGSRYPIDALNVAGVDMATPAPVEAACRSFAKILDELEKTLEA